MKILKTVKNSGSNEIDAKKENCLFICLIPVSLRDIDQI